MFSSIRNMKYWMRNWKMDNLSVYRSLRRVKWPTWFGSSWSWRNYDHFDFNDDDDWSRFSWFAINSSLKSWLARNRFDRREFAMKLWLRFANIYIHININNSMWKMLMVGWNWIIIDLIGTFLADYIPFWPIVSK